MSAAEQRRCDEAPGAHKEYETFREAKGDNVLAKAG
jgi:hypothetical protein